MDRSSTDCRSAVSAGNNQGLAFEVTPIRSDSEGWGGYRTCGSETPSVSPLRSCLKALKRAEGGPVSADFNRSESCKSVTTPALVKALLDDE